MNSILFYSNVQFPIQSLKKVQKTCAAMTFECLLHVCTGEMHTLKLSWALSNSFFTTWEWLFPTDFIWMFMHNVQRAYQTIQQLWWHAQDVENSSNNCSQYFYINSSMSIPESIDLYWPVEIQKALPALRLEVLDVLGLIQDKVPPGLPSECLVILQHQLVWSDADMEGIGLCPTLKKWTKSNH